MASPLVHPSAIRFEPRRSAARQASLGLTRPAVTYHQASGAPRSASVMALRCHTSQFCFPELGRLTAHRARRPSLPLGSPRVHRA